MLVHIAVLSVLEHNLIWCYIIVHIRSNQSMISCRASIICSERVCTPTRPIKTHTLERNSLHSQNPLPFKTLSPAKFSLLVTLKNVSYIHLQLKPFFLTHNFYPVLPLPQLNFPDRSVNEASFFIQETIYPPKIT